MVTSSLPPADLKLSPDEARLITLQAQGLVGAQARRGGVPAMLRRLGAVQLDTISVLARSHELVAYARLGPVSRTSIERAYWHPQTPAAFEYWAHAACVLPVEEWPYYSFRRRWFKDKGMRWHENHPGVAAEILAKLRSDGPLTTTDLGGSRGGGAWWDWSQSKIAVEWLLDTGDAICVRRIGWRRVYDLPERVLPPELLAADPTDAECLIHLARVTASALGVVTKADLSDYQRIANFGNGRNAAGLSCDDAAVAAGLLPVEVGTGRGASIRAWADPAAVATLSASDRPARLSGRHRVTLLSPFDSLIWDRKRTLRMFGYRHALEAYVPKEKRVHGYYTMPLLAGGQIVGRVDPARDGKTLLAKQVTVDKPAAVAPMARALAEAAQWVGCDTVHPERVSPSHLAQPLLAALRTEGVS